MKIYVPTETLDNEPRIALLPDQAAKLVKLGAEVTVASQLGQKLGITDDAYEKAGATVSKNHGETVGQAEMILRLNTPNPAQLNELQSGAVHISYLDPFNNPALLDVAATANISAISMEMIPRTTIAQKMDSLSSQANLGGYVAVTIAAYELGQALPMMMTPAGTLSPAKVFIIGAGVAGLQAIATAKRLGARVEAFDTRPVVEEQVQSLGAKFLKVDIGEIGQTEQGYAKPLTEEQLQIQREAMAKACAQSDIVITTAQVFGRKAPVIMTKDMVEGMKPGSVIVDMAVESGGNVEGSELDKKVDINGVKILGHGNLPGQVPQHASQMYSSNLCHLITHFWDNDTKTMKLNTDDEIIAGSLLTHGGKIIHERFKKEGA